MAFVRHLAGFGAAEDPWAKWCKEGGAAKSYGGDLNLCQLGANGKGALVAFQPPHTLAGIQVRFTINWGMPTPAEYEPERIWVTAQTDPVRFAWLTAFAALVTLPVGSLPGVAYTSQFPLTLAGVINPMFANGLTLALAQVGKDAIKNGENFWQRAWNRLFNPVFQDNLSQLIALATLGPTPAAVLQITILREANRVSPPTPPLVKAFLLALAEETPFLSQLKDGPDILKEEWAIQHIGDILDQKVAKKISDAAAQYSVRSFGRALHHHANAISALLKSPNPAGAQKAFDLFFQNVTGIAPFSLAGKTQSDLDAFRTTYRNVQNNPNRAIKAEEALALMKSLEQAFTNFSDAVSRIKWAAVQQIVGTGLAVLSDLFAGRLKDVMDLKKILEQPVGTPISGTAQAPGGGQTGTIATSSAKSIKPGTTVVGTAHKSSSPPSSPPTTSGSGAGGLVLGVIGGGVVGGPVGALVGGALGTILSKGK